MIPRIDEVLRAAVARGDVPNLVAVAATDDGVIYEGAAGPRVAGGDEPVTPDSMLRIASMTKIVTTVAALQQVERGTLELDAPVDTYCPQFADLQVLVGFDGDTPKLRPPATRATVRQLLTHTAGLSYWFWNTDILRWEQVTGTPNVVPGLGAALTAPMIADPGTRFEYGINTDWLGRAVEAASGQSLPDYFRANIFEPLGMGDTTFLMSAEQRARWVPTHIKGEDGAWVATDADWNQRPDWWAGGHGLYTTPREFLTFQRMLLGGGSLSGAQILRPETVRAAFTNQIGDLDFPAEIKTTEPPTACDFVAGPGMKWGFGLLLNTTRQPGMRAAGSGGWAGLFNTFFWVDPTTRVAGSLYTQSLPFATPEVMSTYADFEKALYAAL